MSDFKPYVSTAECEARIAEEYENVVTAGGMVDAPKGSFIIRQDDGTVTVADGEQFKASWKPKNSKA